MVVKVATTPVKSVDEMLREFRELAHSMRSLSADLDAGAEHLGSLITLAESEDPDDLHVRLLERCHEYLTGRAPATLTRTCLISDLARVLGR